MLRHKPNQSNQSGVYIMNASKVKPSQAHGNEEVLRAKAAEANRKRAQRKREQAWEEAEERARQEAEEPKAEEPKAEEPKAEEPKAEEPRKDRKFGKVIKVRANGIEYATLTEFVITLPNCGKIDGKHSAYAISQWNKINGQLKKKGYYDYNGIIVEAI